MDLETSGWIFRTIFNLKSTLRRKVISNRNYNAAFMDLKKVYNSVDGEYV